MIDLPVFICGGAAKCGTTTIYDILRQHNQLAVPKFKEIHFFSDNHKYHSGRDRFLKEFERSSERVKMIADFSPTYLSSEQAPGRIADTLGTDVKFLFVLRNPVDRSYSQYLHNLRDLREDLDFIQALEAEKERDLSDFVSITKFSYLSHSLYYTFLKNYFTVFKPENIKVVIFEEFFSNIEKGVNELIHFLGIDELPLDYNLKSNGAATAKFSFLKKIMLRDNWFKSSIRKIISSQELRVSIKRRIQAWNKKEIKKVGLDDEEKSKLISKYFLNDIRKLEELLHRDLKIWYED